MPLKIWACGNLFHSKCPSQMQTWFFLLYFPDEQVIYINVFLTPCCQLWTFANTFVIVCVLCTEITSWLPDAAYFACCSTVAFKVYPVEWKRRNEGRGGGSSWLLFLKRQYPTYLYSCLAKTSLLLDLKWVFSTRIVSSLNFCLFLLLLIGCNLLFFCQRNCSLLFL